MTDELLLLLHELDPELSLKYNKFYIGVAKRNGTATNFVLFNPKRDWVRMRPRLEKSEALQAKL
jgi:hypothetical protein